MEEGRLRCDANISVRPVGQTTLGTKAEIKNMNSFKNVKAAIDYEAARQKKLLEKNEQVIQETRLWDADKAVTKSMRSKEEAHDYRYFPEPDLPLIKVSQQMLDENQAKLPELPQAKRARFVASYGLSDYDASVLTGSKDLAAYFEKANACYAASKTLCNWIAVELLGYLNKEGKTIQESPVQPEQLAGLVEKIDQGTISGKMGKEVFSEMLTTGEDADAIIKSKGMTQISDPDALDQMVDKVINDHPGPVTEYRNGKVQAIGFLVGQVMKISRGQANPKLVNQILKQKLEKEN